MPQCYVCHLQYGQKGSDHGKGSTATRTLVECPRCGPYEISDTVKALFAHLPSAPDFRLSAYIREMGAGRSTPILLDSYSVETARKNMPHYSVSEKMQRVLLNLASRSFYPGQRLSLHSTLDFVTGWAENKEEYSYLLQALVDRGLLKGDIKADQALVCLTPAGWDSVESTPENRSKSSQVFVAMSFSELLEHVYRDAIAPAIEAAGYSPYRVDREHHIERIDSKIIKEIKNSKFVVADVTDHKQGVYYEAGFAQGLGLDVIWSVRSDDLDNAHFDTRQYAHIKWADPAYLKEELQNRIEAVIGRGPKA